MTTSGQPQNTLSSRRAVILLLADIGQTTWRMFLPTLGGFGLGIWADHSWHTTPWLMCGGLGIGIALAAGLMVRQFRGLHDNRKETQ